MNTVVESETQYDKLVNVSIYISIWLLSCILLWTYQSKYTANVEYNKLITKMNTKKLERQMKNLEKAAKQYSSMRFQSESMDTSAENPSESSSGIHQVKKKLYIELLKSIELYDKCNYIKSNATGAPFPYTEVMISCILLLLICAIIVISNLTNNPFTKLNVEEQKMDIQNMIDDSFKNYSGGQTGGSDNNVDNDLQQQYNRLQALENKISSRISFMKSDSTFNYISLSFSIIIFTIYIAYNMLMNSVNFENNLYSGRLFMKSRCY